MFDRFLNIMLLWSPLEPFKVDILIPLITWFDISFFCFGSGGAGYCFWLFSLIISTLNFGLNSTGVFAFFLLSFITAYLAKSLKNMYLYPNVTISLACSMVVNIINLILTNLGPKYFNSVFFMLNFVFFFIFITNSCSMVPFSFAVTSQFLVTFTLAAAFFVGLNVTSILKHGLKFFILFFPSGAPQILVPFLFIIEVVSYIARVFSLAIRLFANIMAGHTLVKILGGFAWTMGTAGGLGYFTLVIPLFIVFVVCILELVIAALQAYVFVMLLVLYYHDAVYLH